MDVIAPASALALLAAVLVAGQAIAIRHGSRRAAETVSSSAFTAALSTVVVSVVIFWSLFLARGVSMEALTVANAGPFVVAGLLNPAGFRLLYFKGIDDVGAPVASAIMAMNPLVVTILAVPLLGETVTLATGLGVLGIVSGGVIVQTVRNASDDADGDIDLVARRLATAERSDLLAPVGAMVLIGVSYVIIEFGLTRYPDPIAATSIAQTAALIAFVAILLRSSSLRRQIDSIERPPLAIFAIAGVFTAFAQLANFFALNVGTAVTVIPLFNTFPLMVLVFTYAIARELPRSATILFGVCSIVVGSILIEVL